MESINDETVPTKKKHLAFSISETGAGAVADLRCMAYELTHCGTFPTLTFGHIADAAFARSCRGMDFAVQQVSPEQPFKRVEYGGT